MYSDRFNFNISKHATGCLYNGLDSLYQYCQMNQLVVNVNKTVMYKDMHRG